MAEKTDSGLTGLDWVVIVSATVAFVMLATWIYQERHRKPPGPENP